MSARFLVLVALGAAFGAGAVFAEELAMVRGITLLKAGEKASAYRLLEASFRTSRDANDRARTALMLALAEQKYLKTPRYVYAEYTLRNYRNLESAMALRLTRIIGDGRFELGDLDGAKRSFQFILASPTSSQAEKEYATYKLGWIYMNEDGPERAFRLWQNWLEQGAQGELREVLLRDAGRAWAEATVAGKILSLRLKFSNAAAEQAFYAGILEGAGEKRTGAGVTAVLAALASNHIYGAFLAYLLEHGGNYFAKRPCDSVEWLSRADAVAVHAEKAQRLLEACQKRIDKKLESRADEKLRLLAAAYARYPRPGAQASSAKAATLLSTGDYAKACLEYANSAVEHVRRGRELEKVPDLIERTRLACMKLETQDDAQSQALRELTEVILASRALARHFRKSPDAFYRQLLGLAQLKGMREVALQQLVKAQEMWADSGLPAAFLLDWQNDLGAQLQLLNAFLRKEYTAALAPGFVAVMDSLVRARRFSDAQDLLFRHLPVEKIRTVPEAAIWAAYLEADPAQKANFELYRGVSRAAVRVAANGTARADRGRLALLGGVARLAVQQGEMRFLAENLGVFEPALLADAAMLRAFLQAVIFDRAVGDVLAKARSGLVAGYTQAARALVAGKAEARDRALVRSANGAIARIDLHADLLAIDALRTQLEAVSALRRRPPAELTLRLESARRASEAALARAKKHRWSSELAWNAAKDIQAETSQSLAALYEGLPAGTRLDGTEAREHAAAARKLILE